MPSKTSLPAPTPPSGRSRRRPGCGPVAGDEIGRRDAPGHQQVDGVRRRQKLDRGPASTSSPKTTDELAEVRWVSLAEADELLPGMYEPVREHLARELAGGGPDASDPLLHRHPDGTPQVLVPGRHRPLGPDGRPIQERQTFTRKKEAEAELAPPSTTERHRRAPTCGRREMTVARAEVDEYLEVGDLREEESGDQARSYGDALRCPRASASAMPGAGRMGHPAATSRTCGNWMLKHGPTRSAGRPGTGLPARLAARDPRPGQAAGRLRPGRRRRAGLARNPVEHVKRPEQVRASARRGPRRRSARSWPSPTPTGWRRAGGCRCTVCAAARSSACDGRPRPEGRRRSPSARRGCWSRTRSTWSRRSRPTARGCCRSTMRP